MEVYRRREDPHRAGRVRGEAAVSERCRREGIHPTIYYQWSKGIMEVGRGRIRGDTKRGAGCGPFLGPDQMAPRPGSVWYGLAVRNAKK